MAAIDLIQTPQAGPTHRVFVHVTARRCGWIGATFHLVLDEQGDEHLQV